MSQIKSYVQARPWVGWLFFFAVLAVGAGTVAEQQIKLTDGTFGTKVVVYTLDGQPASAGAGDASAANQTTQITHLSAIQSATESAASSLDTIETNLSADAVHGNAVIATGPQIMGEYNTAPVALTTGQSGRLQMSSKGELFGVVRDAAGNGRGANVNASNQLLTAEANSTSILAALAASTQSYRTSAGATEDEFQVKATAGVLTGGIVTNTAATVSYLKCSNLTAANTTPGSSTVFFAAAIPGATTGAGFSLPIPPGGLTFDTALTCYLVKGAADTDVAEVGANEIKANIFYR